MRLFPDNADKEVGRSPAARLGSAEGHLLRRASAMSPFGPLTLMRTADRWNVPQADICRAVVTLNATHPSRTQAKAAAQRHRTSNLSFTMRLLIFRAHRFADQTTPDPFSIEPNRDIARPIAQ